MPMYKGQSVSAVITCGGQSVRFGQNKLLVGLGNVSVIEYTVRAFVSPMIDQIVVVVSAEHEQEYRKVLIDDARLPVEIAIGGAERHLSAMNGLRRSHGEQVIVHDGVRPFVTHDLIRAVLDASIEHGAAMLGLPSTVQVKLVSESAFVTGSLDRASSWLGQTPQAFRHELLASAYDAAVESGYTRVSDDADIVAEFTGQPVKMVPGHVDNIKITTPLDYELAQLIAGRVGR
jgi:2-C-methyl-D-erythritol 4-phosphate cytidylyltransferase